MLTLTAADLALASTLTTDAVLDTDTDTVETIPSMVDDETDTTELGFGLRTRTRDEIGLEDISDDDCDDLFDSIAR